MKSKQELIEEWESAIEAAEFYGKGKEERLISYMKDFVSDLKQLDEPETVEETALLLENVLKENKRLGKLLEEKHEEWLDLMGKINNQETLSQEWIQEKSVPVVFWTKEQDVILVKELQNLLVPKQELPVIPNYVAKWISEHHEKFDLYLALRRLEQGCTRYYDAYKWYRRNTHTFVNAYLTGKYEIEKEKEQKYYAKIKGHDLVNDSEDGYWNVDGKELYIDNIWHDYSGYKITKLTKDEWNNLGINEDNADFVKVGEEE